MGLTAAQVLDGCQPGNPTQGGYVFGQDAGEVWHEGEDLNTPGDETDCWAAIRMPVPAIIRWAGYVAGYGNSVWAETIPAATRPEPRWLQMAHMIEPPRVSAGQPVGAGAVIGLCGKTGGSGPGGLWPKCHVHTTGRISAPPGWGYWPSKAAGWGLADIQREYFSVTRWLAKQELDPMADTDTAAMIDRLQQELAQALTDLQAAQTAAGNADGINRELGVQIEGVRAQLAARDSENGALRVNVIGPLTEELGQARAEIERLRGAVAIPSALGAQVALEGGRTLYFIPAPGSGE